AVYPIEVMATITGLPTTPDWSLIWGSANTSFGYSVATAGDVNGDGRSDVIVGAKDFDHGQVNEGAIFLFLGHPLGLSYIYSWSKEADQAEAHFGYAVASAGDVNGDGFADVIAGAPEYDHPDGEEGGAWVYHGAAADMDGVPDFFAQSDQAGARLGESVATAGDVNGDGYADVIVGGRSYTAGSASEGAAWVWHGSANGVNGGANGTPANAGWHAESNEASAFFGISVATAGDVNGDGYADVIVGANQYGGSDQGAAMAWYSTSNGVNNGVAGTPANADWIFYGTMGSAHLGRSVSTAGDVNGDGYADVIVGAPHYSNGQANEGAAYLFLGSGDGIEPDPDNQDEGNSTEAWFGQSVACAGDVNGDGYADVVVGAPLYTNDQTEEGRAFLWYGSGSGISISRDWWDESDAALAWYGNSVATAGDVNGDGYSDLIVGAYGQGSQAGSVSVYHGGPDLPSEVADWDKPSNQEDADFGFAVASAGDVNADGYADIIVGSPLWDSGGVDVGAAWIYRGSAAGLLGPPYWNKAGSQPGAQFGYSVGSAGDVDGDGYGDVIVGAPFCDSPQENEGCAWVYHGSGTGVSLDAGWSKESDQPGAQFGYSVGSAGDVNGDGYGDVIAGAPLTDHGQTDEGVAWLYLGTAAGLNLVPAWHTEGDQLYAEYGTAVATAGDVNADGYSDVIVGAPFWEDDADNEGRIWVYHGSPGGLRTTASWHAEANRAGARLGHAVGTAGDVNGDGYSDVIAGAPYWGDGGLSSEGRVWVFYGSGRGVTSTGYWYKESNQDYAYYGYSVGTAGDVNGDGLADILIGAPAMDRTGGPASEGLVRLYLGSFSGVESSYAWTTGGNQANPWYGVSVSTAGDLNGDGYADIVIGARDYTDAVAREGVTFVYHGNDGGGVPLRLQQLDDSGHPLAPLGHSDRDTFRLALTQRNPFGRGGRMYEVEVKPLGVRFTGSATFRPGGVWANPALGIGTSLYAGDLHLGTPYHWRLRMLYDPATTPWMPASRWVTVPWNGWNEEDLRTHGVRLWVPVVFRNYP
ncbi:MAG TPA: integrin alpha, partial [Anaerolineae bacterium]|nr:integrin alpha [Anaerolineae bacterium]